jgi:antitoxin (DNA-binding transcriptional repressor) of toxin-antitoxin stability system
MKFVSTREVRNNPSAFREAIEGEEVVLTLNGKPFAIVLGIDEEDLESTLDLLRQLRAQQAVSRLQRSAVDQGLSALSMDEIDREIRQARKERRSPT